MIYYDPAAVPPPFPLENATGICHLNSILQCLCCCPAFTKQVLGNQDYMTRSRTGSAILSFVLHYIHRPLKFTVSIQQFSSIIMENFVKDLRHHRPESTFGNGQESFTDGLPLLLEMVAAVDPNGRSPISDILTHRYRSEVTCLNCGAKFTSVDESLPTFDMFYIDNLRERPTTPETFSDAMLQYANPIEDFTCEKCGTKGDGVVRNTLIRAPEIIMCVFNIYNTTIRRENRNYYFPERLEFPSSKSDGVLNYRVVAQVEHVGTMTSGHYTTRGLHHGVVYNFNDSQRPTTSTFEPTKDTYIVLYHIIAPPEPGTSIVG